MPRRDAPRPGADGASVLEVWVRPGASRTHVGGWQGDALVVAVTPRAVEGAATAAVIEAVAEALGLRRRQVSLIRGATARRKLLGVALPPDELDRRIARLTTPG